MFSILNIFGITYYPFSNIFVNSCLFIVAFIIKREGPFLLFKNVKRCDDKVKGYTPKDNTNEIEVQIIMYNVFLITLVLYLNYCFLPCTYWDCNI